MSINEESVQVDINNPAALHEYVQSVIKAVAISNFCDPNIESMISAFNETTINLQNFIYDNQQLHLQLSESYNNAFTLLYQRNEIIKLNFQLFELNKQHNQKLEQTQSELSLALANNQKLTEQNEQLQKEHQDSIKIQEGILQTNQELENKVTELTKLNQSLETKVANKATSIDDLNKKLSAMSESFKTVEQEKSQLKILCNSTHLIKLQNNAKTIANLSKQLTKSKNNFEYVAKCKKDLETESLQQTEELKTKENEITGYLTTIKSLTEEVMSLKSIISTSQSNTVESTKNVKKKKKKKKNKKKNDQSSSSSSFHDKQIDFSMIKTQEKTTATSSTTFQQNSTHFSRYTPFSLLSHHLLDSFKKEQENLYASICPRAIKSYDEKVSVEKTLSSYPTLQKVYHQHSQSWINVSSPQSDSDDEMEDSDSSSSSGFTQQWPNFFKSLRKDLKSFIQYHLEFRKKFLYEFEKGLMPVFVDCYHPQDTDPMGQVVSRFLGYICEKYSANIEYHEPDSLKHKLIKISQIESTDKCMKSVDYVYQIDSKTEKHNFVRLIVLNHSMTTCSSHSIKQLSSIFQ